LPQPTFTEQESLLANRVCVIDAKWDENFIRKIGPEPKPLEQYSKVYNALVLSHARTKKFLLEVISLQDQVV
jgi:flagellum-specific peptidoglycan hydrolase FlgJ